jgi:hypothetical protein
MSREEREKIIGVYLTIDTLNYEKKPPICPADGEMVGSKYPRILRSEAHERRSNTSISDKTRKINRMKTNRIDNMNTCQRTVFGRAPNGNVGRLS